LRRLAPRGLGAALEEALPPLRPATTLARVQEAWPAAAGDVIAAEAEPVSERDGTVTFECRSSVWAQELQLLSGELIARLRTQRAPGEGPVPVTSVRFVASAGRRP
jgi:predicted nucleic acid-binding Zn ribbon protein